MAGPSILIPQGLNKIHPQLELSLKSIKTNIAALQSAGSGATKEQIQSLQASLANLQRQITEIQTQIDALPASAGDPFHPFLLAGC